MNIFSRSLMFGALSLVLLLAACNMPAATQPAPIGTIIPSSQSTDTAMPTSTNNVTAAPTALIPITGMEIVSLQCQFCVNDEAHAVLIMSKQASFNVADPAMGITCATAEEINGRRVLLCRGEQHATFTLNVCVDAENCLQFPVTLQPCPLVPGTGVGAVTPIITFTPLTPIFLTPVNTLIPRPTRTEAVPPPPTSTVVPPTTVVTPTTPPSTDPVPTETEPAATNPPATPQPTTEIN